MKALDHLNRNGKSSNGIQENFNRPIVEVMDIERSSGVSITCEESSPVGVSINSANGTSINQTINYL